VLDGQQLFCGGINVLDDWFDPHHGPLRQPRFDLAVSLRGPVVAEAVQTMARLWWRLEATLAIRARQLPRALQAWRQAPPQRRWRWSRAGPACAPPWCCATTCATARASKGLPARHRPGAPRGADCQRLLSARAQAAPRPGAGGAARRAGALLLQGRYEYFMQHHAARPVYGRCWPRGRDPRVRTELSARQGGGDRWQLGTVGSSNLDPLSLLLAREANVVVDDRGFARQLRRPCTAMHQAGRQVQPGCWRAPLALARAGPAGLRPDALALWVTGTATELGLAGFAIKMSDKPIAMGALARKTRNSFAVTIIGCLDRVHADMNPPHPDEGTPVSLKIRERLAAARKRFNANDNIAEFIEPGELEKLLDEVEPRCRACSTAW
jgi:cardiolipin synthase